jgi:hypothetical protein
VAFSGPSAPQLPRPIREAGLHGLKRSATMWTGCRARRGPLLGQVFRGLGHNPWVLTLVGPPGSYKTSVAAKAMQHFGERWEHKKPASSMSGNGDTFNALRFKLHNAKDCLYWMDDFAPTRSWLEAQKHLKRPPAHPQPGASRSSRDGLSISDDTGPRASVCTSGGHAPPRVRRRTDVVVPRLGGRRHRLLFPWTRHSRHQRALVMASTSPGCWTVSKRTTTWRSPMR